MDDFPLEAFTILMLLIIALWLIGNLLRRYMEDVPNYDRNMRISFSIATTKRQKRAVKHSPAYKKYAQAALRFYLLLFPAVAILISIRLSERIWIKIVLGAVGLCTLDIAWLLLKKSLQKSWVCPYCGVNLPFTRRCGSRMYAPVLVVECPYCNQSFIKENQ